MEPLMDLQQIICESRRMVFFGGAGVSTESGIPDFRSVDGLYHQKFDVPPETILSHSYYVRHPDAFFRFYREKMICTSAQPNAAHRKLAELEQAGILSAIVTQNIDGLHQLAGSHNVLELHGSVLRNTCERCGARYGLDAIVHSDGVPMCEKCGGRIKPDVVLYEEALDEDVVNRAVQEIRAADVLMIAGTSLAVYPAAGLIRYFNGRKLVLINRDPTPMDGEADLVIHGRIGETLAQIQVPEPRTGIAFPAEL